MGERRTLLLYLDQNYASRIAKFRLGLPHNEAFGAFFSVLLEKARAGRAIAPPSPFHVLELHGGYLLPAFRQLFAEVGGGFWVRPWQAVVRLQAERGGIDRADLLTLEGGWDRPADLAPLWDLLDLELTGPFYARAAQAAAFVAERLGVPEGLPFVRLLARLLAFRSMEARRKERLADLVDLVMAATVVPYVDALGTDRYLREALARVGVNKPVFSGRNPSVLDFARWLRMNA